MGIVKEHREEIDGITYTTKTFPASDGLEILIGGGRFINETVLGALVAAEDEELGSIMTNPKFLISLFVGIAKASAPGEFSAWVQSLLEHTKADKCRMGGEEKNGSVYTHFDEHFAGRYMHLLSVATWVFRVGFAGP